MVLDESFAALDPETLERALTCVLRRARTLTFRVHRHLAATVGRARVQRVLVNAHPEDGAG